MLKTTKIAKNKEHIMQRILSGIAIGLIFIIAIFLYRPLFTILIYLIAALMLLEWFNMTNKSASHLYAGLPIVALPIASLLIISDIDDDGWLLFSFFCLVWSVDTMAMVGGKLIGGMKLAPSLSPNKTVSGLCIGVLSAMIVVNILSALPSYQLPYMLPKSMIYLNIIYMLLGVIAQLSDLFISYFKRHFSIKDSGTIIPGHGGVLDRFDSIILTAPLVALYLISNL
ncbi:MAG: phosphatidate cytidylyltransferase [Rickettsiales bacterium]|nr:MAG: phosphatidate cytidylyltransferase [Rickettsiales bacterium]